MTKEEIIDMARQAGFVDYELMNLALKMLLINAMKPLPSWWQRMSVRLVLHMQ